MSFYFYEVQQPLLGCIDLQPNLRWNEPKDPNLEKSLKARKRLVDLE